jgi:V/A-type H+-transporting ATPase subunit K
MVKVSTLKKTAMLLGLALVMACVFAPLGFAAEEAAADAGAPAGIGAGLIAIGAGIAIAGGAMATGRAQASIGAAGAAAMTEKPELFGRVFILVALPETMVVLGFVLGILIALNI